MVDATADVVNGERGELFCVGKGWIGFDVGYWGKSSRLVFSSFQHFLLVMFVLY